MSEVNLIFAGSGAFGVATLRKLSEQRWIRIGAVVTQVDRPAGRGRQLAPTAVAAAAAALGLHVIKTADMNAQPLPGAELLVVIAFGQKISAELAARPRLGSVNLHASLLPRHRGASPVAAAILAGDRETGNSIIRLAQRMDAGAIVAQSRLAIGSLETAGELHDRLAADGAELMAATIEKLAAGTATEMQQDDALATAAPKLSRDAGLIEFGRPAAAVARQIRAMYPWPGCRVQIDAERATLVRAADVDGRGEAGMIDAAGRVGCGVGAIEVVEIQPDGKRPMPLGAYRNGHPWRAGLRVMPIGK